MHAVKHIATKRVLYSALIAVIVATLCVAGYNFYLLKVAFDEAEASNSHLQYGFNELIDKLNATNAEVDRLNGVNSALTTVLQASTQEKDALQQQTQSLSSTVSTLDKLVHTDKQLLEKYSSVYFLNENYIPRDLYAINNSYLNRPDKPEQVIIGIVPHLTDMLKTASDAKVPLQILSAYRSYGTQSALKSSYKVTYGSGTANSFSADQGYSEHQLGTAIDFTTPTIGATLAGFDKTTSYAWMQKNAHLYGFILSYPKGNTHFVFEPWHWRYVGVALATKLHNEGKALYDMDQRDIDQYLIKFFD